jgi:hypothetical protein
MKKKEHSRSLTARSGEMQQRRGRKKDHPFMTDRGQWLATEREAEIAAIHHSETPSPPLGYYDQFGDWHMGWFEYPQYAIDVERRLRALREGKAFQKKDIDIFAEDAE